MHATDHDTPTGASLFTPPGSWRHYLWKVLALTGLYLLAGIAGVLLSQSTGYASPIWPATGMATAGLLIWGWRCWPGVFLGDLLIDLSRDASLQGIGLASLTAAAATVQTLLCVWLVQRYLQGRWQVARDRRLVSILFAAGPLTCLIAPTLGSAVLVAGGRIASDDLFNEWLRWWAGDTLGVLLFAPLALLLWPGRRTLRGGEGNHRFALPLVVTLTLLIVGHLGLSQLEDLRARSEARTLMEVIGDSITQDVAETLLPLEGLAHFIAASPEVTREEFRKYTQSFVQRPAILWVDWAPRVDARQRAGFEAAVAASGFPGYRIVELDSRGRLQPAAERAEYFPVLYSEPLALGRTVLGLDHGSEPMRHTAMRQALDHGKSIASDRIRLVRSARQASLLFVPVHRLDAAAQQAPVGYVVGALDIQQLFAPLRRKAEERQFALRISDVTAGMPRRILSDSLPAGAEPDWHRDVHASGRVWRLEMYPKLPLWRPGSTAEERLFLGFAVLTAFLATFATLGSAGRHALVSRVVAERTAQLAELNSQLQQRIEERGQALTDLHAKEAEIHAVLDHLLECVITIDSRGIVQSVNPAIEPLLGYRPEELVGRNISCLMASPLREHHDDYIARYLQTGERHIVGSSREVSGRHKDGQPIALELSVSEYRVHGQRFFIGTLRDIRELKALIASLTQAREEAEQASRAKSAFLATMSHEIRTPMNGVVGLIDVLTQDQLPPHQADLVRTIRESSGTLLGVIDDILDFSRIEAGRLEIEHAPLNLVELLDNLCDTLRPLAVTHGVRLDAEIAAGVPPWIRSDAMRLRQILFNLIGNAIKFSGGRDEQPGRVVVGVRPAADDPQRLLIDVTDNGIGIAAEHLGQLFQPFSQAESSTTRRFGGSGLGLAICRRLVELLGGEIAVASTPGHGTRFTVSLPLTLASAPQPAAEPAAPAAPVAGVPASRRLLVVEDDAVNRKVIRQQLALLGYDFTLASQGSEALSLWRQGGFDLILSDLHMPEMDGYQLARRIRAEEAGQRRIPILALTANAMRGEAARAVEAGMDEYLTKPIRLATLQTALARWLPQQARPAPAEAGPGPDDQPLVDATVLAALVGADREMIREILGDYAESLRSLAPQLLQAFARNDCDSIDAIAHRLKSSSRAVGAVRLGQLCTALEQAIKDSDSAALAHGMAEFHPLHHATAAWIDRLLKEGNPV